MHEHNMQQKLEGLKITICNESFNVSVFKYLGKTLTNGKLREE